MLQVTLFLLAIKASLKHISILYECFSYYFFQILLPLLLNSQIIRYNQFIILIF